MDEHGPYDDLVRRLQALRDDVGQPSFGDIATSVSRVRRERGLEPERARVGRTTVYDAFRIGRHRIDADLVGDIARALGADEETAGEFRIQARRARATTAPTPVPAPEESLAGATASRTLPARWLVAALVTCLVVNLLGRALVDLLDLPVYLDMVGTACAAILLGPWWGALVGGATNVAGVAVSGPDSLLFVPVNVAGALVWGYGVRRLALARSIPRFFVLNLLVAFVCSSIAVPTIVMIEHGFVGHGADMITASAMTFLHSVWASVSVANLLTSIVDKLIAGFVALTVLESLPAGARAALPAGWLRDPRGGTTAVRACSDSPGPGAGGSFAVAG